MLIRCPSGSCHALEFRFRLIFPSTLPHLAHANKILLKPTGNSTRSYTVGLESGFHACTTRACDSELVLACLLLLFVVGNVFLKEVRLLPHHDHVQLSYSVVKAIKYKCNLVRFCNRTRERVTRQVHLSKREIREYRNKQDVNIRADRANEGHRTQKVEKETAREGSTG